MASNHTTNYQLNQWEKTDRIMMDDFNSDNEKIDTALASRLGPIEDILPMQTLTEAKDDWKIPLPEGFDPGAWSILLLETHFEVAQANSNSYVNTILLADDQQLAQLQSHTLHQLGLLFPARTAGANTAFLRFPDGQCRFIDLPRSGKYSLWLTGHNQENKPTIGTWVRLRGIR